MATSIEYDPNRGIWTIIVKGELSVADIVAVSSTMYGSEEYVPGAPRLWDARGATAPVTVSGADLQLIVELPESIDPRTAGKVAVVVSRDLDYGMSRMYQAFAEKLPSNTRIFRDIAEAERWLLEEDS